MRQPPKEFPNRAGWTLIELVIAIGLLGLLASATSVYVGSNMDSNKYDETRQRMAAIRNAIIGDLSVDNAGNRSHFGYVGDMGRLPSALTELVTRGSQAAWAYDATQGFGFGWRGPYVNSQLTDTTSIANDAWGTAFVYQTSNTATVMSAGSDKISGGTGFAKDVTMEIPQTLTFANVFGVVADKDMRFSGKTVTIHYPLSGVHTTSPATTDANGSFSFAGISQGVRSIELSGSPAIAPVRIVVDRTRHVVPPNTFDLAGKPAVTLVTAERHGAGNSQVLLNVSSTYPTTLTVSKYTVSWPGGNYLWEVVFAPFVTPLFDYPTNCPSGTRVTSGGTLTLAPNTTTQIRLAFSVGPNGAGLPDMSNIPMTMVIEWVGNSKADTLSFTPT